jgi:deoxycytidylate deaminase
MRDRVIKRAIDIAYSLNVHSGKSKHFSFIVRKNSIVSVGWNKILKTHPIANKYNYPYNKIHSELDSIINFDGDLSKNKYEMLNIRIGMDGRMKMSRPCKNCRALLNDYGLNNVTYSNEIGFSEFFIEV